VTGHSGGVRLEGNPDHPISRGYICFKAKRYNTVHSSPDRLTRPLLRTKAGWKPLSHDEAMDVLASRLLRHRSMDGAESVVFYTGEALKHQENKALFRHLAFSFGTPNFMSVSSVCHAALDMGYQLAGIRLEEPDLNTVRAVVIWGANPFATHPLLFRRLRNASAKGTPIIGIDPLITPSTRLSDLHLQIRPGTDGFLALAFLSRAIESGIEMPQGNTFLSMGDLLRHRSIDTWLSKTGVESRRFDEACDLLFRNLPVWICPGVGLELNPCGVETIRAIAWLQRVLNSNRPRRRLEARLRALPGSGIYSEMPHPIGKRETPHFVAFKGEGQALFLKNAVLNSDPYPVKAMVIAGGNPMRTFPDTGSQKRMLEGLSFLAVFDLFMTQTAQLAHLILPAADFLETMELHDYGPSGHSLLGLVRPVVTRRTGLTTETFVFELAKRLGLQDRFPWNSDEEAIEERLEGSGVRLEELLASSAAVVRYESTAPSVLDRSFPNRIVPSWGPSRMDLPIDSWQDNSFWLSSGNRSIRFQHSQFRNIPEFATRSAESVLLIHPKAADKLGIRSGNRVCMHTAIGSLVVKARRSKCLREDSLCMIHGEAEVNVNAITRMDHPDPLSGYPWMRALPVRLDLIRET